MCLLMIQRLMIFDCCIGIMYLVVLIAVLWLFHFCEGTGQVNWLDFTRLHYCQLINKIKGRVVSEADIVCILGWLSYWSPCTAWMQAIMNGYLKFPLCYCINLLSKCNAKRKPLGCKKVRPIRNSSYLTIHATKSFNIS